jgi:hypothetical protein
VKTDKRSNPAFDCVAFKRRSQARIYRKIKGLSPAQQIEYFDQAVAQGPFAGLWQKLVAEGRHARPAGRLIPRGRRTA